MATNESCPVCWNPIIINSKNYCITECNHVYHLSCFAKCIACKNYKCPLCRHEIIKPEDHIFSPSEDNEDNSFPNNPPDELQPGESTATNINNLTEQNNSIEQNVIKKIESHLQENQINFLNLIELVCYLEHEEFENKLEYQSNADFIFGKFRQVINSIDPTTI